MSKFVIIEALPEPSSASGKAGKVLALRNELADAFAFADGYVIRNNCKVEIFERISTGKPVTAVTWEGRRRPTIANGG
jgi:hypothetical protein